MLIENSFDVDADPDRVFDFLQNPHNVATCFPGAELTEDLGDDQYKGKVKIKLGPVTAAFSGIARITEKDAESRLAVLVAEGKDARGSGTAKATATMKVEATETGSSVLLKTDLTISGKLAQFGRGIMADVSGRMVNDLAVRVRERIESEGAAAPEAAAVPAEAAPAEAVTTEAAPAEGAATPAAASAGTASAQGTSAAKAEGETADSGALSGATTDTATATTSPQTESEAAAKAPATTPAGTSAKAAATTPAAPSAATSSEPAGAIKASTLLKVMIVGMFRRLFARLRGRSHDAESR
jgi:carbon monoxide dehydrogenase subunit G